MSLDTRWNEYRAKLIFINQNDEYAAQRAFYAGAESSLDEISAEELEVWENSEYDKLRAEIARLRTAANPYSGPRTLSTGMVLDEARAGITYPIEITESKSDKK